LNPSGNTGGHNGGRIDARYRHIEVVYTVEEEENNETVEPDPTQPEETDEETEADRETLGMEARASELLCEIAAARERMEEFRSVILRQTKMACLEMERTSSAVRKRARESLSPTPEACI
jgi:hypothetical protein